MMRWFDKNLHDSCRMGRRIVLMKLICSLGRRECNGHTEHKLGQRCLTADWLAPRVSNYSRMYSKVSSHWLPSYINATQTVLEIFKMARSFRTSLVFLECPMLIPPSVSGCGYWYNQTDGSSLLISNDEWHSGLSSCPDIRWVPGKCLQVRQKEKLLTFRRLTSTIVDVPHT